MLFALLLTLSLTGPRDVVTLKPGGSRPNPVFYDPPQGAIYRGKRKPFKTAFLNGKRTDVTIPGQYDFVPSGRWNAHGRTIGYFDYIEGMLRWEAHSVGYTTSQGRLELLSFVPQAIDDKGRVIGVKQPPNDPSMSDPYNERLLPRGMLWSNAHVYQLGLAEKLWFGADGTVQGYYATDRRGKPVSESAATMPVNSLKLAYHLFSWTKGRRVMTGRVLDSPPSSR